MPSPLSPEQQALINQVKACREELDRCRERERRLLNDLDRILRDGEAVIREVGIAEFGRQVGMTGVGKAIGPRREKEA